MSDLMTGVSYPHPYTQFEEPVVNNKLDEAEKKELIKERIREISIIFFGLVLTASSVLACIGVLNIDVTAKNIGGIIVSGTLFELLACGGVLMVIGGAGGLLSTYFNPYKQREVELQTM